MEPIIVGGNQDLCDSPGPVSCDEHTHERWMGQKKKCLRMLTE